MEGDHEEAPVSRGVGSDVPFWRGCFWGFSLLGLAVVAQFGVVIVALLKVPPEAPQPPKAPPLAESLGSLLGATLPLLPAALLFYRLALSRRWRQGAMGLAAVAGLDVVLQILLLSLRTPGAELARPEPFLHRMLLAASSTCTWGEFWWIVVLIAEFAIACQREDLVRSTERLGYAVLAGGAATLALWAWVLPSPQHLHIDNETTVLLGAAQELIFWVTTFWTVQLLAGAALVSRFLTEVFKRRRSPQPPSAD